MSMRNYTNVADVFRDLRELSRVIEGLGFPVASKSLVEVLDTFWTTGSEALIEVLNVLDEIEESCGHSLRQSHPGLLDEMRSGIQKLLKLS